MGKTNRKGKPRTNAPIHMESDEDMYDEVDKFHREDRKIDKKKVRTAKVLSSHEVLNVEGDKSDEEEDDVGDDESDFDADHAADPDSALPSREQWGKRKKEFYNAGYVDNDYGGVGSSDEEELANLEEADAIARQKKLDAAAAIALEEDVWTSDLQEEKEKQDQLIGAKKSVVVERKWKKSAVENENEELVELLEDIKMRSELFKCIVRPLQNVAEKLPLSSKTRKQIGVAVDVYSSYLMTATLFAKMKAKSFENEKMKEEAVDGHPVIQTIEKLKKMLGKVDEYLDRNGESLKELQSTVEKGREPSEVVNDDLASHKPKKNSDRRVPVGEIGEDEEEKEDEGDGKRKVSYAIEKNKGLKANKKKGPAHSRAQKRKAYDKALVRRRSQVPDIRREDARYAGEARGIRVSTVKSTKLS